LVGPIPDFNEACDGLDATDIQTLADSVGDKDGRLEPGELDDYDLDANQLTIGASSPSLSTIYAIAFVDNDGVVDFDADIQGHVNINDDGGPNDPVPADDANLETCEGDDDLDCGTSVQDDGDGVVVATITAPTANQGDVFDVDIEQGGIGGTETIQIVGVPDDVQVQVVESTIESGASAVCTEGFLDVTDPDALANTTSTIAIAVVTDNDGIPLTRIVTSLTSDDPNTASVGDTTVLTVDAGNSGIAAFAVVCGVDAGSTFITANIGVEIDAIPLTVTDELTCNDSPALCATTTTTPVIGCDPQSPPCPTATPTPDPADSPPLCEWPLSPPNCAPDTDGDGVPDKTELWLLGTDPNDPDTDTDSYRDRPQLAHASPNVDLLRDNCPIVTNAAQLNNDGNFINYFSVKVFNDVTAPRSDAAGDACDVDDDNDSILDQQELLGVPCGSGGTTVVTDPADPDSDDDLVLDSAECIFGTDPTNINSMPPVASCVAAGDADGDRMLDSREDCFYGTDPNSMDSDSDGCTDGAEIASVNGDTKVDSLDLAQIAQSFNALGYAVPALPHIVQFDINRDRKITSIDLGLIAQQFNPYRCM
jgi:hypothetical protein